MPKFYSRQTYESKTYPGVTFVLNLITEARRIEIWRQISEPLAEVRKLTNKVHKLEQAEQLVPKDSPEAEEIFLEKLDHADSLDQIVSTRINPVYMKSVLHSIDNMEVDDEPLTPDRIMSGPPALYVEILAEIRKQLGITEEAAKNSESANSSLKPEDGQMIDLTATSAKKTDFIEQEIAVSISPI